MAADNQTSNNPFSVRMDEDEKLELLKLIQESGKGSKDFMSVLVGTYKLSKAKIEVPAIAEDIKHLEAIVTQICDIYIGMGKRITTIEETKNIQYNKDLVVYKDKIAALEENIEKANTEKTDLLNSIIKFSADQEETEKQLISLQNTVEDKNKLIEDKVKLIEEYKDKNDNLLSMLTDLKTYKEKVDTLSNLLTDNQSRNILLENEIVKINNEHENTISKINATNENTINNLNSKVKGLEELLVKKDQEYTKQFEEKNKNHSKKMEDLKKSLEYEKDKALLDQEKKFNKVINENTNENNGKIAAIQEQSNKQILEYQKQIDILLKRINDNKPKENKISK
jgi:hypothetical protein